MKPINFQLLEKHLLELLNFHLDPETVRVLVGNNQAAEVVITARSLSIKSTVGGQENVISWREPPPADGFGSRERMPRPGAVAEAFRRASGEPATAPTSGMGRSFSRGGYGGPQWFNSGAPSSAPFVSQANGYLRQNVLQYTTKAGMDARMMETIWAIAEHGFPPQLQWLKSSRLDHLPGNVPAPATQGITNTTALLDCLNRTDYQLGMLYQNWLAQLPRGVEMHHPQYQAVIESVSYVMLSLALGLLPGQGAVNAEKWSTLDWMKPEHRLSERQQWQEAISLYTGQTDLFSRGGSTKPNTTGQQGKGGGQPAAKSSGDRPRETKDDKARDKDKASGQASNQAGSQSKSTGNVTPLNAGAKRGQEMPAERHKVVVAELTDKVTKYLSGQRYEPTMGYITSAPPETLRLLAFVDGLSDGRRRGNVEPQGVAQVVWGLQSMSSRGVPLEVNQFIDKWHPDWDKSESEFWADWGRNVRHGVELSGRLTQFFQSFKPPLPEQSRRATLLLLWSLGHGALPGQTRGWEGSPAAPQDYLTAARELWQTVLTPEPAHTAS